MDGVVYGNNLILTTSGWSQHANSLLIIARHSHHAQTHIYMHSLRGIPIYQCRTNAEPMPTADGNKVNCVLAGARQCQSHFVSSHAVSHVNASYSLFRFKWVGSMTEGIDFSPFAFFSFYFAAASRKRQRQRTTTLMTTSERGENNKTSAQGRHSSDTKSEHQLFIYLYFWSHQFNVLFANRYFVLARVAFKIVPYPWNVICTHHFYIDSLSLSSYIDSNHKLASHTTHEIEAEKK